MIRVRRRGRVREMPGRRHYWWSNKGLDEVGI